ncbi:hypothetical protein KUTeg_011940 [Tegillarca granosa]|uniref:Uncharacterized protein n=1 Tax=Tegillarca granosa TaxID=220873 RepID=A0ABQ9F1Q6_TEGGR|nr:hypothetical protein KUTeg_011940 [Tegillarca granosa]
MYKIFSHLRISGECAHLLATIMTLATWFLEGYREVQAEQSSTSMPQIWDKPRGPKVKPEPVSQLIVCKPTTISRKRRP